MKTRLFFLFMLAMSVSLGMCCHAAAQTLPGEIQTYEQVRLQQDSLAEITATITANSQSCRRIYSELQSVAPNTDEYRTKFSDLQKCVAQSQQFRGKFTDQSSAVFWYKDLNPEHLQKAGWTKKQIGELHKWWDHICDLAKKIGKTDKSGPSYDTIKEYVAKLN